VKVGDLVKPRQAYLDDYTSQFYLPGGIIIEVAYEDLEGDLEPETAFFIQWPGGDYPTEWQDFELEMVSESR